MQRTYFQGLKLKPSFDQIVGYLENDQQFMAHPDRTYTRLKNDPYYSNLNMAGVNSINAQSDNLLKEQARQLDRTKQMQTLGLSQPQVTAANIASGSGVPVGQQYDIGTPPRPLFLPDPSSGRGSGATSGYATPAESHTEYLARVVEAVEYYDKQEKAKQEAKKRRVQDKVADDALTRDTAKATLTGIYGRVQQQKVQGEVAEAVPTQGASSSGASASASQPAITPLTPANYEAKEKEYWLKTAEVLNRVYYAPKLGRELVPTKLDRDDNGNLNDHFKNKLISRLLEFEFKGLHVEINKQRKASAKPLTQYPDVELQQKGRKTKK